MFQVHNLSLLLLGSDSIYSLPWGWGMDMQTTVQEKDICLWPRRLEEPCYSTWSKCLCLPMGSAMLPCCSHAFTVALDLASQPPWTRTKATWDMLLACFDIYAHALKCIIQKRGEGSISALGKHWSEMSLLHFVSIQGRKVLNSLWRQFLCVSLLSFSFLFFPLPTAPHSCFNLNSTRFSLEEHCHLLSLITQQHTEIPFVYFGQLGLIVWIMEVGFDTEPGRRVN